MQTPSVFASGNYEQLILYGTFYKYQVFAVAVRDNVGVRCFRSQKRLAFAFPFVFWIRALIFDTKLILI